MKRTEAFTMIEVMLTASLVLILSTVGLRSMFVFAEQRKLRTAAVELSGYLQVARTVAGAANAPCTIALKATDGGTFAPDASSAQNSCRAGTIAPDVQIGGISGSSDLQARVIEGNFPITFTPQGTLRRGATVLVSSANVPDGGWCVGVQAPLGTVRLGWRPTDGSCNFRVEQ